MVYYSDDGFAKGYKASEQKNQVSAPTQKLQGYQIDSSASPKGKTVKIQDLAFCRSGDKGNHCNIGVIARNPEDYQILDKILTVDFIAGKFRHYFDEEVKIEKFYLPGTSAFNFMLYNSLGGGGVASLRPDPQGKAYGQILASFEVEV